MSVKQENRYRKLVISQGRVATDRQREIDELLPWDTLDMGVKKDYFIHELEMAKQQKPTMKCFDNCKRCGVC